MMTFMRFVCVGLITLGPMPGLAQSPIADILCAPRAEMTDRLKRQFRARPAGMGLRGPEAVMEMWTDHKTGSWTLVMSYANGNSCIVAMGEHWQQFEEPA